MQSTNNKIYEEFKSNYNQSKLDKFSHFVFTNRQREGI